MKTEYHVVGTENAFYVSFIILIRIANLALTGKIDVRGVEIPGYEFVDEGSDTEDRSEEAEEQGGIF